MSETETATTETAVVEDVPESKALRSEIDELRAQIDAEKSKQAVTVATADDARRTNRLRTERDRLREELAALQAQTVAATEVRVVDTVVRDPETGVVLDPALVAAGVQEGVIETQVVSLEGDAVVVSEGDVVVNEPGTDVSPATPVVTTTDATTATTNPPSTVTTADEGVTGGTPESTTTESTTTRRPR